MSLDSVGNWRRRYRELGLEGLHDELRSGRPRTYEDAAATGISKTNVHRWLQTFPVQPHRQKHYRCAEACGYKLSTDPFFA